MKGKHTHNFKTILLAVLFMMILGYMLISTAIGAFSRNVDTSKVRNTVEINLEKYTNYKVEDEKGTLVQLDVKTGIEYEEGEEYVPLKSTAVLINVPKINDEYPESVDVIEKSTKATNGDSEGKNVKYSYDSKNGKIIIAAFNMEDEEGNIYKENVKDAKDNFSVVLNYGKNCYTDEKQKRELNITGIIQTKLATEQDTKIQNDIEQKIEVEEKVSDLISNNVKTDSIYNGFIKLNSKNNTKYTTDYKENFEINISKKQIADETKIEITDKFLENEEKIDTQDIIYTSSKLNKDKILNILGENGTLKILDDKENVLAEINKDTQVDEEGNYEIKYEGNVSKLYITFTKPEKVGIIKIINNKQIKETVKDIELTGIEVSSKINGINKVEVETETASKKTEEKQIYSFDETKNIKINESKTSVKVVVDNANWTNKKQNEINLNVQLLSNHSKYNLFKNPTIAIKLPNEVEKVILDKATLMYGNGLKLKATDYNEASKTIFVTLEGEQTEYLENGIADGTDITIPATIILNKNIESKASSLGVTYNNAATGEEGNFEVGISLESYKEEVEKTEPITQNELQNKKIETEIKSPVTEANKTGTKVQETKAENSAKIAKPSILNEDTTITAQGMNMTVKPIRGDVTLSNNDTVYEGEFIKYEVTLKNTTNNEINNIKVSGFIPEGLSYAEAVKTDDNIGTKGYNYDEELEKKQLTIDSLKAGKEVTVYYEVRVNDLPENETEKTVNANIKAYIGTGLAANYDITHNVKKAEYKVLLTSYMSNKNEFVYKLEVSGEKNKEVETIVKLPENLEFYSVNDTSKCILYKNESIKDIITINAETNKIYTIKTKLKINENYNNVSENSVVVATVNNIYKSNQNRTLIGYRVVEIKMTSDTEGNSVHVGDELNYEIDVSNIGKYSDDDDMYYISTVIEGIFPECITPTEITYNKYEYDEENKRYNEESTTEQIGKLRLHINIPYKKTINIKLKAKVEAIPDQTKVISYAIVSEEQIGFSVENKDYTVYSSFAPKTSNEISNIVLPVGYQEHVQTDEGNTVDENKESVNNGVSSSKDKVEVEKNVESTENLSDNNEKIVDQNNNSNDDINYEANEKNDSSVKTSKKYDISGVAWIDNNADGEKQDSEDIISEMPVYLLDSRGNKVTETTTSNRGIYKFSDIEEGKYIVVFKYDNTIYNVTKYEVNVVSKVNNSNAIQRNIEINGEEFVAGVTDTIELSKDISNINIGLVQNKKFDFKVDSFITKVSVKTGDDTKETNYNGTNLAKTEVHADKINGAVVTVEYKIVITNNGDLAGTVNKIVDYLPNGFRFSGAQNTKWVINENGNLINTSLANKTIEPGKTEELTLILFTTLNDGDSIGTFTNKLEIEELKNEFDIQESNNKNNTSQTDLIISISTGIYIYISLIVILIVVLTILQVKYRFFKKIKIFNFMILLICIVGCFSGNSRAEIFPELTGRINNEELQLVLMTEHNYRTLEYGAGDKYYGYFRGDTENEYEIDKNDAIFWREVKIWDNEDKQGDPEEHHRYVFLWNEDDLLSKGIIYSDVYTEIMENGEEGDIGLLNTGGGSYVEYEGKNWDGFRNGFTPSLQGSHENAEIYKGYTAKIGGDTKYVEEWAEATSKASSLSQTRTYVGATDLLTLQFIFVPNDYRLFKFKNDKFGESLYCTEHDAPGGRTVYYDEDYGEIGSKEYDIGWYKSEHWGGNEIDSFNAYYPLVYSTVMGNIDSIFVSDKHHDYEDSDLWNNSYVDNGGDYNVWVYGTGKQYNEGSPDKTYKGYNSNEPQIKFSKNNEENSNRVDVKSKNVDNTLIGPLSISAPSCMINGQSITWNGKYNFYVYAKDGSQISYTLIDEDENSVISNGISGNKNKFYIQVSSNVLLDKGGIWYIQARTDLNYKWNYKGTIKGCMRLSADDNEGGDYQDLIKVPSEYNYSKKDEGTISWQKTWTNFEGAMRIQKVDEIGYPEDYKGDPIDMTGISFIILKIGNNGDDQWVYGTDDGNVDEYGPWDVNKVAILKTKYGDGGVAYTDLLVGLEPSSYGSDGYCVDNYEVFEIIKDDTNDGVECSLPERLAQYYKADGDLINGFNGCPYQLKRCTRQYSDKQHRQKNLWSGEFFTFDGLNKRDFISLQVHKEDQLDRPLNFSGIKFKVFKAPRAGGTYGWVQKDANGKPAHNKDGSLVYKDGDVGFNNAYELTSNQKGDTEVLEYLDNNCGYYVYETYIPDSLKDYYALEQSLKTDGPAGEIHQGKKLTTSYQYLEAGTVTNGYYDNTGRFYWNGENQRDRVSVNICKKNEKGELLDGVKFKILDVKANQFITVDNNNIQNGLEYGFSTTNTHSTFTTGEYGKEGFTRVVRQLKKGRTYQIYEVDPGPYKNLYKLDDFTFNNTKYKATMIKEITIDNDYIQSLKEQGKYYKNQDGVEDLYDVYEVEHTNIQYYGSLQIEKEDELTEVSLEGIGFVINVTDTGSTDEGGYAIIGKEDSKYVVTGYTSDYREAYKNAVTNKMLVTNKEGFTEVIERLPLKAKYEIYEVYIPNTLQSYFTLDQIDYTERYEARDLDDAYKVATGISITKGTQTPDNKKSIVTHKKYKNDQVFITISGHVWEDGKKGKNAKMTNNEYDSTDYDIQNIKVSLVDKDGNEIKYDHTNSDGEYDIKRVRIDQLKKNIYHIQFQYDGVIYEPITKDDGYETIDVGKGNNKRKVSIPKFTTSNGTELSADRTSLNNKFTAITGSDVSGNEQQIPGTKETFQYDRKKGETDRVYSKNTVEWTWIRSNPSNGNTGRVFIADQGDFVIRANTTNNYLKQCYDKLCITPDKQKEGYNHNKSDLLTEIPNINLGLFRREEPDLSLSKDTYSAKIEVNGKEYTYLYGQKMIPAAFAEAATSDKVETQIGPSFQIKGDDQYKLAIHKADVEYELNNNEKTYKEGEFKTSIVYAIGLVNNSENLYTRVNKVKDYFSTDFTISNYSVYENARCRDQDKIAGATVSRVTKLTSNKLGSSTTAKDYNTFEIDFGKSGTILEPKKVKYIFIKLEIPKHTFYDFIGHKFIDENKKYENHAEIASYTTFSDKKGTKVYAQFDYNSVPNNYSGFNGKQGRDEDDSDFAPGLKLEFSPDRNITGYVFEDKALVKNTSVNGKPVKLRLGNGKRDSGETGVANVTVQLVPKSLITPTSNEYTKYAHFTTYDKEDIKDYYNNWWLGEGHAGNAGTVLTTKTNANGKFTLTGIPAGDYAIRYIWGTGEGTKLKNGQAVNVGEYKSTQKIMYDPENIWHLEAYQGKNYSEAIDNWEERLDIDKNLPTTYKDMNTYDSAQTLQLNRNMNSWTDYMNMEIELVGSNNMVRVESNGSPRYAYNISSIDFGLVERAKQQMEIEKELTRIRIIDGSDRVVVDAEIETKPDGSKTFKNLDILLYTVYLPESDANPFGTAKSEMDKDYMPLKLEATYKVTVSNTGENDYGNQNYYYNGINRANWFNNPVKLHPTNVYDYLSSKFDLDTSGEHQIEMMANEDYTSTSTTVTESGYANYITSGKLYQDGTTSMETEWEESYKKLETIYEEWYNTESGTKTARELKLDNNKILELMDLETDYEAGDTKSVSYVATAVVETSEEGITLGNDAEIVNIDRHDFGKTKLETYTTLYRRGEQVTITPPTGENRDQTGVYIFVISVIAVLSIIGTSIIIIKKKFNKR